MSTLAEKYSPTPRAITREQYDELLGCLPPMNWERIAGLESFQLCELAYDNITQTCTWDYNTGEGWSFYAPVNMTREAIAARVAAGMAK